MLQIDVVHTLPAHDEALQHLVGIAPQSPGTGSGNGSAERSPAVAPKLNDELLVQFRRGEGDGFIAAIARDVSGQPIGYAQASPAAAGFTVGLVVDESSERPDVASIGSALFGPLFGAISEAGGGEVTWWAAKASPSDDRLARHFGMTPARTLLEMRSTLPLSDAVVAAATPIAIRPFVVGQDEVAWLQVNNRAFAGHHEQSGWTVAMLRARQSEPWFAADDLLLHERDGRLAGFCWTKLHPPVHSGDQPAGEIYVIGVDPDFTGLGLGRALAVAGYRHAAERGAGTALLFVDEDNLKAIRLYESIGLRTTRRDIAYSTVVSSVGVAPT